MSPRARGTVARFAGVKPRPAEARGLAPDHPAAVEGRTLFPGKVAPTAGSARFLVSGHNNAKIGKTVLKGPWTGMPIYTLTLEERATCPRSCEQWLSCYGNSQHWPSRWDHRDPEFLPALVAEVLTTARQHPEGFVVRLHVLGDFYSPEYVLVWAKLLQRLPNLRIYGYTARRVDDPDPASAKIARALQVLTDHLWDRFAVRTSSSDPVARSRAIVVEADPHDPDVIVCPAATGATEACVTCGLCWSENARDKTIAFLLHGIVRSSGPRLAPPSPEPLPPMLAVVAPAPAEAPVPPAAASPAEHGVEQEKRALAALTEIADDGGRATITLARLALAAQVPAGSVLFVLRRLEKAKRIVIRKDPETRVQSYQVLGFKRYSGAVATPPPPKPTAAPAPAASLAVKPPQLASRQRAPEPVQRLHGLPAPLIDKKVAPVDRLLAIMKAAADAKGNVVGAARDLCDAAGIAFREWDIAKGLLVRRGAISVILGGGDADDWIFQILDQEQAKAPSSLPAAVPPAVRRGVAPSDFVLPASAPTFEPCTLMNLRSDQCHWPTGDARPQLYCGARAVQDEEYCGKHLDLKFGGKGKRS